MSTDHLMHHSFLNFPAELRLMIYDYYEPAETISFRPPNKDDHGANSLSKLIQINRRIRYEAIHYFCSTRTIEVGIDDTERFREMMGQSALSTIKSVRISGIPVRVFWMGAYPKGSSEQLDALEAFLDPGRTPSVLHVSLEIHDHPPAIGWQRWQPRISRTNLLSFGVTLRFAGCDRPFSELGAFEKRAITMVEQVEEQLRRKVLTRSDPLRSVE